MSIWDTLFPWTRLKALKTEISKLHHDLAHAYGRNAKLRHELQDAKAEATKLSVRTRMQKEEIMQLHKRLDNALTRDPVTGRIKSAKE